MPEIDPVILQLRADVAKYNAEMQQTARRVDASLRLQEDSIIRLDQQMGRGFDNIGRTSRRTAALVGTAMGSIKGAIAGVSAIALARSFLTIADEAKKLDATLRLATQGFGSFGQAQRDVDQIADETRSGLTETADLYANFVRGAKELGATQSEAARATETFSKTLKISGADAGQAASATLQFGQALASGALRGDELNSILEASPRLARLIAESMGQPIGAIRKMGEEGKLTSDKLLAALTDQKFTDGIDAEFRQIPVTFEQSMTRVYNSAIKTFSAFDQGGQFSAMLASFFNQGADGFSDMEDAAFNTGAEIRATFAGLTDVFQPMIDAAFGAFDSIEGRANYARDSIANILRAVDKADNFFIGIDNFGRRVDNRIKGGINEAARRAGNTGREFSITPLAPSADRAGQFLKSFNRTMRSAQGERAEQRFRSMTGGYDVMGSPVAGTSAAGRGKPTSVPSSSNAKKTREPKSKLNPEAFAREESSLNDQILRLKADELVNASERAQAEVARIEAAKQAALKEIAGDERYTAEQKAKVSALTETVAALETARVVVERETQAAKDSLDVRISGLRNEQDLLRAQSELTGSREERRDIELRLLDLAYEQERADLEAIVASKEATDAQKQIARARLAMLGRVQDAEAVGINRQHESPLEARRREVRATAANLGDAMENIELDAVDRLTDGLADASTEYIKLGGIAGEVINGMIRDMVRLAAQQAIFGKAGGGGGIIGTIGGLLGIGGAAAGGDIVLGGATTRYLAGARANGGPVAAGRTYLVGEEGPELFTAPSNGSIVPNHMIDTSAARSMAGVTAAGAGARPVAQTVIVKVEANDYFDAKVQQGATAVAAPMAMASGMQARSAAGNDAARAARRRIPGR